MLKKMLNSLLGEELDIKERLFRIIMLVGMVAVTLAILQGLMLINADSLMGIYILMFLAFVMALIFTFKFKNSEVSSIIVGVAIVLIALPIIFFRGGGINSGSATWMCLGVFYIYMMFRGKKRWILLSLTLLLDASCYIGAYYYPEWIVELATPFEVHFDSFFAVTVVGLTVGTVLDFQIRVYEKEREKTLKQQELLENVSRSKDTFFASMSHEIRTPINSIVGLNELILRENPSEEVQEYANNIQSASKMLLSLINDILDLSQLEIQKMKLVEESYNVKNLFRELVDVMQVRMSEKNLKFLVEIDDKLPIGLLGDERRIKQIILNILTNAVKYTKEGSVTMTCRCKEKSEDEVWLVISVADTGIGIRKEDLDGLFDAFMRVHSSSTHHIEGTGLGLSITKYLIALMGGTIEVDSIYTQGSMFTITIPQKVTDATHMGAFMTQKKNAMVGNYYSKSFEAPEARVLIIDDDDLNLIITTKLLQETKMSIDTANSVEEALRKTKKRYYHLIFMDYMMPDRNGSQALMDIRKQENGLCRETPVILLSANVFGDKYGEHQQMGFDGFLEKPIDATKLEEETLKFIPEELIEYRRDNNTGGQVEGFASRLLTKKRKRITIATDSVSDLPRDIAERLDIKIIDLYIKTNYGRFRDTKEIDVNNLMHYLSDGECRADSLAPSVNEYEKFFAELLTETEDVIYFSLSQTAGKCYGNAVQAARGFSHVQVIDTKNLSCGQGLLVIKAAEMVRNGATVEQIIKQSTILRNKVDCSFVIDNVTIFRQKGFTDPVTAGICNLFHWHPILKMYGSRLCVLGVRAGRMEKVWRRYIRYHLRKRAKIDNDVIMVIYAGMTVQQQEIVLDEIKRCIDFQHVIFAPATSSNVCNAGLGSLGMGFFRK